MSAVARLGALTGHGRDAQARYAGLSPSDQAQALSPERHSGWKRILCSLATTESIEKTLLEPVARAFASDPDVTEYLLTHMQDEERHHHILSNYVRRTFHYEKTRRSLSDRIVYDTILPRLGRLLERKPVYGLAMVHFCESFGIAFYRAIRDLAEADGLSELAGVLKILEREEHRHLAGVECVRELHALRAPRLGLLDRLAIRFCLGLMLFDMNMTKWALHNRGVRDSILKLNLDPEALTRSARAIARGTLATFTNVARSAAC